jgi:hypothetical protein
MYPQFKPISSEILELLAEWEPKLNNLPIHVITERRNNQNRTIKQILGHMIDSASNNTHRIVHFQYRENPLQYPNYASNGNNDRWIAIQNYQDENWGNLIQLWKYSNIHYAHVINNINADKLDNVWIASPEKTISMRESVIGYLDHLKLHLGEIDELIKSNKE